MSPTESPPLTKTNSHSGSSKKKNVSQTSLTMDEVTDPTTLESSFTDKNSCEHLQCRNQRNSLSLGTDDTLLREAPDVQHRSHTDSTARDGETRSLNIRERDGGGGAGSIRATSLMSTTDNAVTDTHPFSHAANRVNYEGFPDPPSAKSGKLRFSEIPRRSKLTLMILAVANFGAGCGFSLPAPFFPREAAIKGASPTTVGLVFSSYQLVNFLAFPVFGSYISQIGAKFMYTAGIVVSGGCSFLFGFLDQGPSGASFVAMAFLVRGVEALGISAFQTASFAIVSKAFPNHISSVFGILETCIGIGLMIGPTIGGALYEVGGFGLPFWVIGAVIVGSGVFFFGCLPPPLDNPSERGHGNTLTLLRSPLVWVSMLLVMAGSCSLGFLDPTLAPHLSEFDLSTFEVSLFFIISPLIHAVLSPFWGYLSDQHNIQAPQMVAACIFCALGFLMIGPSPLLPFLPRKIWLITLGLVTYGLLLGCTMIPTMKCIVIGARELGLPDSISTFGLVSGLFNSVFSFGAFVGPTVAGVMVEWIGFEYGATIIAGFFLFGFLVSSTFFGLRRLLRSRTRSRSGYTRLADDSQHTSYYLSLNNSNNDNSNNDNSNNDNSNGSSNGSSNKPLGHRNATCSPNMAVSSTQQHSRQQADESSYILGNGGKISVSSQTPKPGRFLQSFTISSSGQWSW